MKNIKNHFKAVLFDMDGTIINSEHIWHQATLDLLASRGIISFTKEQQDIINSFSGIGLTQCIIRLKEAFNLKEPIEQLFVEKQILAANLLETHLPEFIEGFEEFHAILRENQIPSCVATNADAKTLEKMKEKLNFPKYFGENLFSISHIGDKAKPDPAIFLHAAEKLGVKPSECIVFEDSLFGFMAAKAAGMQCIAIKSPTNADKLHHVDHSIDNYHSAIDALREIVSKKS